MSINFKYIPLLIPIILGFHIVNAQSALNPSDPVITYTSAAPPATPQYDKITKWVRTVTMTYNTDSYKCYIYKNMAFRLKFPKTYVPGINDGKKYPIFLFFAGVDEKGTIYNNENQLLRGGQLWASRVDNGQFDGYLLFPLSQGGYWGTNDYDNLKEIVDSIVSSCKGDPDRLVVNGLSSGGWGTWEFALRYPQLTAAFLPMSAVTLAYGDSINIFKFTPLWLFQGGLDGSPAPYTTNQVAAKIVAAGGNFKLTTYPKDGHITWNDAWNEPDFTPFMLRANRLNPYPLFGSATFCPGQSITIGIAPRFQQYEWQKNSVTISITTADTLIVTSPGSYRVRGKLPNGWTGWSPTPLVISYKPPSPAPIVTTSPALASNVLPAPDGSTTVTMQVPAGMIQYEWRRAGSNTVLSSTNTYTTSVAGGYLARVTAPNYCIGAYSDTFKVINASGINGPAAINNLTVGSVTQTSISLSWTKSPSQVYSEKYFEIYRGTQTGGPYTLVGKTNTNVLTFTNNNLIPNTSYFYKVRPVNDYAAGPVSAEVRGTTAPYGLPVSTSKWFLNFMLNNHVSAPWNNISGATTTNLKDSAGHATNVSLTFSETWWAAGTEGPVTGNNSGIYPDSVMAEYLYFGSLSGFFTGAPAMHGHISGLEAYKTYTVKFYSGSKWWAPQPDNGSTQYTINGITQSLYVQNNTSHLVIFQNVATDATGQINFTLSIPSGGQVGYLNAMEVDPGTAGNHPPVITNISNQTINAGTTLSIPVTATDPDGDPIIYKTVNLPSFVTLVQSGGNTSLSVAPPAGTSGTFNNIQVIALDSHNAADTTTFSITVNTSANSNSYKLFLNFKLNNTAPAPWNNLSTGTAASLKNDHGITTTVGLRFDESWWAAGIEGAVTGNNSGVYPDVVLAEYLYFGALPGFFSGAPVMHGHLTGLSSNTTYTIKFLSDSKWWAPQPDNGSTQFTINGISKTLKAQNNTTTTADFTNLTADANGQISFILSIPTGSQVGYLNAMEIDAVSNVQALQQTTVMAVNTPDHSPALTSDNNPAGSIQTTIYPNPFTDNLAIDMTLQHFAPVMIIEITDLNGKLVYSETRKDVPAGKNLIRINTNNSISIPGVYLLKITTSTGETRTVKLVKVNYIVLERLL